ncbi:ATP-binding protein [Oceaniglobus ichthyenteri]|uniref:ATP-binding protein n=1 Tax=Oceaniglobus ichthyenteri TaxID=2136177 RepID=UPI000D34364D|nr:ATP-binding protein [Oceaniglobus ichthyenteri]
MRIEHHLVPENPIEDTSHQNSVELRLVFPCTQSNVRLALASVMAGLGAMNLSEDDNSSIEIVLAEVLNNVTEHAYHDEGVGMIELQLKQTQSGLSCRVIDTGDAMPRNVPPAGNPPNPDCPLEHQPEGGFGWFLIRHLTRDLAYMRQKDRNILSFRIEVGQSISRN